MISVNKVLLIGRVVSNVPKLPVIENNSLKQFSVTLATTRKFKNSLGEILEDNQWHRLVFQHLNFSDFKRIKKGTELFVIGSIKTKKILVDQKNYFLTEILVNDYQILNC